MPKPKEMDLQENKAQTSFYRKGGYCKTKN